MNSNAAIKAIVITPHGNVLTARVVSHLKTFEVLRQLMPPNNGPACRYFVADGAITEYTHHEVMTEK